MQDPASVISYIEKVQREYEHKEEAIFFFATENYVGMGNVKEIQTNHLFIETPIDRKNRKDTAVMQIPFEELKVIHALPAMHLIRTIRNQAKLIRFLITGGLMSCHSFEKLEDMQEIARDSLRLTT